MSEKEEKKETEAPAAAEEEQPLTGNRKYRKPKPWDTPDIDKWHIEKWSQGWNLFLFFFSSPPFDSPPLSFLSNSAPHQQMTCNTLYVRRAHLLAFSQNTERNTSERCGQTLRVPFDNLGLIVFLI